MFKFRQILDRRNAGRGTVIRTGSALAVAFALAVAIGIAAPQRASADTGNWWGRIINVKTNLCLTAEPIDTAGGSNAARVKTSPCNGGQDQVWYAINGSTTGGWNLLVNNQAQTCLFGFGVPNIYVGTSEQCELQWTGTAWLTQYWYYGTTSGITTLVDGEGVQQFATTLCLDSNEAGNVYENPCSSNDLYQEWEMFY